MAIKFKKPGTETLRDPNAAFQSFCFSHDCFLRGCPLDTDFGACTQLFYCQPHRAARLMGYELVSAEEPGPGIQPVNVMMLLEKKGARAR